MFIDAWLGSNVELDFKGESMEQFTQLINYCQQNQIPYKASMEYREDGTWHCQRIDKRTYAKSLGLS